MKERLEYEGYKVVAAEDTISAMPMYANDHFDLVLCGQPDSPLKIPSPWIRMSHDSSPDSALLAIQQGAVDFVTKPINMNRLLEAVRKGLSVKVPAGTDEEEVVAEPTQEPAARKARNKPIPRIVGDSEPMTRLRGMIDKVAPTNARVLIMGPNGSGKEMVARWLHEKSNRKNGPFIEVNCAAIPSELIESELFGHEKGAFTSAIKQRKGKFETAHGGTLFLDEIGDMSLPAQAKVLRVLQEGKITRVGSDKDLDVDVRVVAATNKHVPTEIKQGTFREDLFHRLSVIIIPVPGLADHIDDIPLLVEHFLEEICEFYNVGVKSMEADALEELKTMPWSGNIRELRNVVERLVILCPAKKILLEDVRMYANGLQ